MSPYGRGRRGILVVGEAPGREEDKRGRPFVGESGQLLRDTLDNCQVDLDRDCITTNSLICRPQNNKLPANPTELINACRPNLLKVLKTVSPTVIVLLGNVACRSLIPVLWKNDDCRISTWEGWAIPCQELNAWIYPTFHPAHILRNPGPIYTLKFQRALNRMSHLHERPWKESPNWQDEIEVIYRPVMAARAIRDMLKIATRKDLPIAADYETNCLKPEYAGAEIVSCALSIGSRTISYPWLGEAIEATSEMWKHPIRKIASNIKFEDRWTRKKLGHRVRGWYWDTMVAAHLLDNRSGITSVKFQSFVLCGVRSYNDHIEPYLEQTDSNQLNRIKEIDLRDLLLYGGMDGKVEWEVAKRQIRAMEKMTNDRE